MTEPKARYWMVWNSERHINTARYKHWRKSDAQQEAERLARANPNCEFVVLKAVGGARAEAPEIEHIMFKTAADSEIPF